MGSGHGRSSRQQVELRGQLRVPAVIAQPTSRSTGGEGWQASTGQGPEHLLMLLDAMKKFEK